MNRPYKVDSRVTGRRMGGPLISHATWAHDICPMTPGRPEYDDEVTATAAGELSIEMETEMKTEVKIEDAGECRD
jgi:hypothetical protein